jgi:hypothetical protein
MKHWFVSVMLVFALLALSFTNTACGVSHDQLVQVSGYGQKLAGLIEANETLPDTLFDQHLISAEHRDQIKAHIARSKQLVTAFNDAMKQALAVEKPDVKSLVPVVADLISEVHSFTADVQSDTYKKLLAGIEVSLRAIATYFAVNIKTAEALGMSREQIATRVGLPRARGAEMLRVICNYADARA